MAFNESSRAVWRENMVFEATTTTGHKVVMDSSPTTGGNDAGARPVELLLTALAGCTGMDVLSILQKKREPVEGLEVVVQGARGGEHPRVYTDIEVVYRVKGNVKAASVERAIELSETKYCGVHAMLGERAHITSRYEIENSQAPRM